VYIIPTDIPAGTYKLEIGLYDLATLERLLIVTTGATHRRSGRDRGQLIFGERDRAQSIFLNNSIAIVGLL